MRFLHITQLIESEILSEINMSTASLKQLASQIPDARAGLEFEMIVPVDTLESEPEPDYGQDQRSRSIDDVCGFFHDGDYNSRRQIDRLRERMNEDFDEWRFSKVADDWDDNGFDFFINWVTENISADDVNQWLERDSDTDVSKSELVDYANHLWEESGRDYDQAREEYTEEKLDDYDEHDWLRYEGLEYMSDIENRYELSWPYWDSTGGDVDASEVAADFEQHVGRDATYYGNYHGADRTNQQGYIVEPDGSLDADSSGETGLEFVSPPLSIPDMLTDLDRVVNWAQAYGCYTNSSCGLHMNVSVPKYDGNLNNLDYTKLAILLGDEYVLEKFGRMANTYCESALSIVKDRIRNRSEDAAVLLNQMKQHLDHAASKVIHTGVTKKYVSINTKENRVEFRSPGGDWINEYQKDPKSLTDTLLRFVVALDAACDPEKYRQEYLKKLYKLLAPAGEKNTIEYFTRYVAGEIPKAALKSFVRQAQTERSAVKKLPAGGGVPTVGGRPSNPTGEWVLYRSENGQPVVLYRFNAAGAEDASVVLRQWRSEHNDNTSEVNFGRDREIKLGQPGQPAAPRTASPAPSQPAAPNLTPRGPGPWEIYRISDGSSVRDLTHTDRPSAETEARMALSMRGEAPQLYGVRTRSQPIPGSTQDLQQRRLAAGGSQFSGQWRLLDGAGRELHTFGGIGNSQADANRVAADWAQRNRYTGALDVVPVMV